MALANLAKEGRIKAVHRHNDLSGTGIEQVCHRRPLAHEDTGGGRLPRCSGSMMAAHAAQLRLGYLDKGYEHFK